MNRAIAWFAANRVAANLLMGLILVGGLSTLPTITQKSFPDIDIDVINVSVEYLGAAPEESEEGVCIRIEEEIEGVEGIEKISSTAVEGACAVSIELISGTDVDRALSDVKNRVDSIDTFPEETEKPIVSRVTIKRGVVDVALWGDADERALKELGQRVRDEIAMLPGITQVELASVRPYEISIEVSEASLRRHGLSFEQVADAVRRSSLDLPGGSVKTGGGEILLRTKGQAYRGVEFEKLVVLRRADGTRILVGDVATVVDGFEDTDQWASFDGHPASMVRVFRVGDQDMLDIAEAVKEYVAEAQARMPEGIELTIWRDQSRDLRDRRNTMLKNGGTGFLLVMLVLALFLRSRLAFWVALGVPISLAGGFWLFPLFDLSIDMITLFAFILVLGILVDDAVVVGENVYTHQQSGEDRLLSSTRGAQEVSVPVIFGVLTTVAAFLPMLLIGGRMGQIFGVIGSVVILCLLFSLVEALWILPAHLGHGGAERNSRWGISSAWRKLQDRFGSWLQHVIHERYRPALVRALDWRYLTLAVATAVWLLALAWVASGRMNFSFFPPVEADYVSAQITMPQGTPARDTQRAVQQLIDAVPRLQAQLDAEYAPPGESLVKHVMASVSEQPFRNSQAQNPAEAGSIAQLGSHLGEVAIELIPSQQRRIKTSEVARHWREITGPIPDAVEVVFESSLISIGDAIFFQLQGRDVPQLREAANRVKARLAEYPGTADVNDSFRAGKQEVKLAILPRAEALGLSLQDMAGQVRQAFYGEEAQRIQRGRDDIRVMVRYPERERRSLGDLESMRIRAPDGTEVPFSTVARAELGRGYSNIRRADRMRVVNVTADVDRNVMTSNEIIADMESTAIPEILADFPGVSYRLEGMQREQQRSFRALARWYLVAIFGIYALLAVPLRSYGQPFLIMAVIPLGVVGAILGHLFMRLWSPELGQLSFMSVIGMVALSGVVVNSSLVFVHFVNGRRAEGVPLEEAVVQAGVARFRPIVLTALTTFAGLTPLLLERSVQAQMLIPMATSLAFGTLFATLVTLFVTPAGCLVLEDLRAAGSRMWRGQSGGELGMPSPPEGVYGQQG